MSKGYWKARADATPEFVDDGLLALRNITAYVCNADDTQAGGYDVHINIGKNQEFDHICFDTTDTLYNRGTLKEAWEDAADWMKSTAHTLRLMAEYIGENADDWGEHEEEYWEVD